MPTVVYNIPITPKPWVARKEKDKILFKMPEEKLSQAGLYRKNRIVAYIEYKDYLKDWAHKNAFTINPDGVGIRFFLPVANRYSRKRAMELDGRGHMIRPDLSNLLKAFEDCVMKEDKFIYEYTHLGKYWTMEKTGWIEITVQK